MKSESGQSLYELVVAIAISALIVVAMVSLAVNSIQNSNFSRNKALASTYAQQALEWLRGQRDKNTSVFIANAGAIAGSHSVWCLSDISTDTKGWSISHACGTGDLIAGTPFTREVTFTITTAPSGNKIVETDVIVSWRDSQGFHEVRSDTNLVDLR